MDSVATMPADDRSDFFRSVAETKGVRVQVIEKDFWVCWALKQLYAIDSLSEILYFKGGTSLSKVFGIIERMSEDIDLVIDREALGYVGEKDPAQEGLSNKKRDRLINDLKCDAADFVEGPLRLALLEAFARVLGDSGQWSLRVDVSDHDNTCIYFSYPTVEKTSEYLRPHVLFELGARGDAWPSIEGIVTPYAAEVMPEFFSSTTATVRTITAERTFWEKATLLHTLAHRDTQRVIQSKPARHYYDVHQLAQSPKGQGAIQDLGLLADVVKHKTTYYRRAADRYDLAVPESLRLVPDSATRNALRGEYEKMAEIMIFGGAPDFEEIIGTLSEIEQTLRKACS